MKTRTILLKAIDRAKANGWEVQGTDLLTTYENTGHYEQIIFDHSFCKAFFGEEDEAVWHVNQDGFKSNSSGYLVPKWKVKLQQMVLEKNPLDYIAKFI